MDLKKFFKAAPSKIEVDILSMIALFSKEEKWCQKSVFKYDENNNIKSYCLFGAWQYLHEGNEETINLLASIINNPKGFNRKIYLKDRNNILIKWNDAKERTYEDVMKLLAYALIVERTTLP